MVPNVWNYAKFCPNYEVCFHFAKSMGLCQNSTKIMGIFFNFAKIMKLCQDLLELWSPP